MNVHFVAVAQGCLQLWEQRVNDQRLFDIDANAVRAVDILDALNELEHLHHMRDHHTIPAAQQTIVL